MYKNPRSCKRCTRPHFGSFVHIIHKQYYIWQNISEVLSLDVCLLWFLLLACSMLLLYCRLPLKAHGKPVQNAVLEEVCQEKQKCQRERDTGAREAERERDWSPMRFSGKISLNTFWPSFFFWKLCCGGGLPPSEHCAPFARDHLSLVSTLEQIFLPFQS